MLGANVKSHADAVLAIMTYTTVPDVTTSSLSINSGAPAIPDFQTQLGGGFTVSRTFPLYLEGTLAYSRYDPTFVASDGSLQPRFRPSGIPPVRQLELAGSFRLPMS